MASNSYSYTAHNSAVFLGSTGRLFGCSCLGFTGAAAVIYSLTGPSWAQIALVTCLASAAGCHMSPRLQEDSQDWFTWRGPPWGLARLHGLPTKAETHGKAVIHLLEGRAHRPRTWWRLCTDEQWCVTARASDGVSDLCRHVATAASPVQP